MRVQARWLATFQRSEYKRQNEQGDEHQYIESCADSTCEDRERGAGRIGNSVARRPAMSACVVKLEAGAAAKEDTETGTIVRACDSRVRGQTDD